jgi:hypothetical protein
MSSFSLLFNMSAIRYPKVYQQCAIGALCGGANMFTLLGSIERHRRSALGTSVRRSRFICGARNHKKRKRKDSRRY